jgi:acetyltransferase-like isoleucine patch superfamily enzyme
MATPVLRVGRADVAPDAEFGDDVVIEADELKVSPGVRIGFSAADDFRTPVGARIRSRRVELGPGVEIGRGVRIEGGAITLDAGVRVLRHATVRVLDELRIGAGGTVGERCEISGRRVRIGQELWMLPGAKIGGGSAFENASSLEAGHYLHLGVDTLINTARPVVIGHEVGLGTRTSIYTHGAYASALEGFPVAFDGVEIGDFTWIPGAIVNPGVRIGRNCVVGVNSLVSSDVPDGCLAAGSPARVIRENAYPRPMSGEERLAFFERFLAAYADLLGTDARPVRRDDAVDLATPEATYVAGAMPAGDGAERRLQVSDGGPGEPEDKVTIFDTAARQIRGTADALSDRFANELRRYGIRFYSRAAGGRYADWEPNVPRFGPPAI